LKAELLPINRWPPHTANDNRAFRLLPAERASTPGASPLLASFSFRIVLLLRWAAHVRPKHKIFEVGDTPWAAGVFHRPTPLLNFQCNEKNCENQEKIIGSLRKSPKFSRLRRLFIGR
jgi:hypothetical protein